MHGMRCPFNRRAARLESTSRARQRIEPSTSLLFRANRQSFPAANRASKVRLNAAAATALSIMIKSLSCRLRPDAEKFAAPRRFLPLDEIEHWQFAVLKLVAPIEERVPKDVRPTGHEIQSEPRKPHTEADIEKRDNDPVRIHDGPRSATRSTSGPCGRLESFHPIGPAGSASLASSRNASKLLSTEIGYTHRRHRLSALCAKTRRSIHGCDSR
jgi:hypothetical protein